MVSNVGRGKRAMGLGSFLQLRVTWWFFCSVEDKTGLEESRAYVGALRFTSRGTGWCEHGHLLEQALNY